MKALALLSVFLALPSLAGEPAKKADPFDRMAIPLMAGYFDENLTFGAGLGYTFCNGIQLTGMVTHARIEGESYAVPIKYPWDGTDLHTAGWLPKTTPFVVEDRDETGFQVVVTLPLGK